MQGFRCRYHGSLQQWIWHFLLMVHHIGCHHTEKMIEINRIEIIKNIERYDKMKIAMAETVLCAMFVIWYEHFAIQVLPRLGRGGWCLPLQWDLLT